ncbi:hypothetical protein NCCP2716_22600 [Sporosarcina sp. NCCP-2716]|uniref:Shedu anti-phage system protein SduA domain-containing protein n=1 Tax=Sporosarcina sp. NCCP-2716 TaxID=2943679 RepID=UPI00203D8E4A|nr:Shedu anti-phage system protein SduA domain-containing protein [Sporosarcina sp. NCCP-2716]GKV69762.1 hypothetical protein NCCP2716_22600 [Sporosarcina sp. NCCP-2716]
MSMNRSLEEAEVAINNPLEMTFDLNTIDHLGVKLYNTFPPVIAELVSNSYDAEAKNVTILIDYEAKKAMIQDDGHGMTLDEINNEFLVIGRNRRTHKESGWSRNKKRKVTGKKGLGKLAVFGITEEIIITSTVENVKNSFLMNYGVIKESSSIYKPKLLSHEEKAPDETNGTLIELINIHQQKITPIEKLAEGLSSRFQIFDEDFVVKIVDLTEDKEVVVTNEEFFNNLRTEFIWNFPHDFKEPIKTNSDLQWLEEENVTGQIITAETPLPQKHSGIIIYARKKLVQERGFFNDRSNDLFNTYVTGYFHTDFIDESDKDDIVATDRKSILWDSNDDLIRLERSLDFILKYISHEWRQERAKKRRGEIESFLPPNFYNDLSGPDRKIVQNIENQLIKNLPTENDAKKMVALLKSLKNQFKFDTFKDYVSELNDKDITVENMQKLSQDWETIEVNEMAKLAVGRIETIRKFENFIKSNASETKFIQPFLEKFPWILEPRMTTFDREVTYSKLLKERFPDADLEEPNRRIDFICSNTNGHVIIIELKRPNTKITTKEINQAVDYSSFLREKRGEDLKSLKTFLISNRDDLNRTEQTLYNALSKNGDLVIKTYTELLDQAKEYHKHFIQLQEDIEKTKDESFQS